MARYEITSPDGAKWEVSAPDGASEEEVMRYAQSQWKPKQDKQAKQEDRPLFDSLGRQIGLTARAGIGAVGGVANMVADPIVQGINAMGGNLPIPSQALERAMTNMGIPEPQGGVEQFAQPVARAMALPSMIGRVVPSMAANLGTQTAAAGIGAGSSEVAKQAGYGPTGQIIAGLAGGVAAPAVGVGIQAGAKALGRAVPGLVEPFSEQGRQRIAARALQGAATDKQAAAQAAKSAPEFVPGSVPTLAQAADDVGIAAQSKAVQNRFPADFAQRAAEQDAARQSGLTRSFGTATDLTMAEANRDAVTSAMREKAFESAKKVNTKPIATVANGILKSTGREESQRAMRWVLGRIDDAGKDAKKLYDLRKDINDVIEGRAAQTDKAAYQLAAGQLTTVRNVLDAQLEKAAPGFRDYLKTYAGMSREIDKARLGQEIADASKNPLTEALSPAKFTREFTKRAEEVAQAGPVASDALTRVALDFRRASSPSASMRAPGSDTLQNMVSNNLLSRAGVPASGPVSNAVSRLLGFAYKPFGVEDLTQQIIRDAHLDPKYGAGLLSMELSKMPPDMAGEVIRKLLAVRRGGLLGVAASQ